MPIFDQGYQHWSGTLGGPAWRWLAITRHGVRASLSNKWLRMALLASMLPAVLLVAMLCVWGLLEQKSALIESFRPLLGFLDRQMLLDPRAYRREVWTLSYSFFMAAEMRLSMLLVLIAGPALISQDLRFNALPLYLSRPLRRFDYFLGKLGVVVALLGAVTIVPAIAAYVLGLLFSLDLSILRDTLPLLLASVAYGLVISLSAGTLILALSSISRNSRYVAIMWLAIWIGSGAVSGFLLEIDAGQRRREAWQGGQGMFNAEFVDRELEHAKTNWRPIVAYTANLSRIGNEMLGTNAVWDKLSELRIGPERQMYRLRTLGDQYPWSWSAAALLGLFGLSAWILHRSITSLDRLK
jgi:ABC-2 type transport system permease protein